MRAPSKFEEQELSIAVRERDAKLAYTLLNVKYPDLLWGRMFNALAREDREWLFEAVRGDNDNGGWG